MSATVPTPCPTCNGTCQVLTYHGIDACPSCAALAEMKFQQWLLDQRRVAA